MARSSTTVEVVRRTQRYIWPDPAINIWVIIMLASAGVLIGVFAQFLDIQNKLNIGVPWLFPFGITVGALTVAFIVYLLVLIAQRQLLPSIVIVLCFILFALFLTGLIETAIQLFGPNGNVNSACNQLQQFPNTYDTLVYLEQRGICQSWYAVFAFWIIGCLFLIWLVIIAVTVNVNTRGVGGDY